MSEVEQPDDGGPAEAPTRSIKIAYLLLIPPLGLLGIHRFYLGRWVSGIVYSSVFLLAFINIELIIYLCLFVGVVVDAFFLPGIVTRANDRLREEYIEHPDHFTVSQEEPIAPWAQEQKNGFLQAMGAPLRVLQFLALCVLFTFVMLLVENPEFILFLVITLLAAGLITSLDQVVVRYPALRNLPGIEEALDRVVEMREYYWRNEPKFSGSLIGMITRARTEYKPYWKIVGLMALAIVLDAFFSFSDDYAPHLGMEDAMAIIVFHLLLTLLAVFLVLSPVSALSFHYSLSGKRIRLRVLTVVALVLIGATFFGGRVLVREPGFVNLLSDMRLSSRMENEEFQSALSESVSMFLFYSYYKPGYPNRDSLGMVCRKGDDEMPPCEPTNKLRELLKGLTPNSENQAFEVVDMTYDSVEKPETWLRAIRYELEDEPSHIIGVIDEFGGMCSRFSSTEPPDWYNPELKQAFIEEKAICDELLGILEEKLKAYGAEPDAG